MNFTTPNLFENQHFEDTKKHNTSFTSRLSFKGVNESGQRLKESEKVFNVIANMRPLTSRMISRILNLERGNVTRCLKDLECDQKIKVVKFEKCPTTGKTVK